MSYIALLVYGSLYPLTEWHTPAASPLHLIFRHTLRDSYADMLTNLLVYMPLGLLIGRLSRSRRALRTVLFATLSAGLLSTSVEYLQAYLPGRVPSILDIMLNTGGAFIGAIFAVTLRRETRIGHWLASLRKEYVRPGAVSNIGLIALGLWILSQLSPLVPSLDVGNLRHGLSPLLAVLRHPELFNAAQACVYALSIAGLGVLFAALLQQTHRPTVLYALLVVAVLALKVPVVSRQLSLEALSGMVMGLILFLLVRRGTRYFSLLMAAVAISASVVIDELRPGTGAGSVMFNWIPFRGQMGNDLIGFADILGGIWPYVALSYLAMYARPKAARLLPVTGGLLIFGALFILEWQQQHIAGRYPDITDAILALAAWSLPWFFLRGRAAAPVTETETAPRRPVDQRALQHRRSGGLPLLAVTMLAATVALAALTLDHASTEHPLDESRLPKLPTPDELPPAKLPNFRYAHPRLPAPTPGDVSQLEQHNPRYLKQQLRRARGGSGGFYAVTLSAYLHPGSQNLDRLLERLVKLKVKWRGHQQVFPMALAYDWLYNQWTPAQRNALRSKLQDGCDYLVHFIRVERLSPYNVYLYNSPFQALVACSIALYGEDAKADRTMRFTYDLWKHRVLPVWRQVMGPNGGWHEGNEYVGIGIGRAVYEVPAMWRKATGEDIFAEEPELHGFLDWLIYRMRPDGTSYRWGDGGFFQRAVPDRIPLAIEYQDAAAYSLKRRPRFQPTAWPWGPLPEPSLYDPSAVDQLPLSRYFDGIGMVVARSGWSSDATYVTFKTGDNYWSHTHLDQGAFTIYKGGPLAIDSGLYFHYSGDHHMDYEYQTIAHNTITVKDPKDTVPAPGRNDKPPRYIANDGGQRRVGSGWGVYSAPLDLSDWKAHYEIYHTGTMERVFMHDGLVVAIADVTPAYTNRYSGDGTFTNRTRRVEKFLRIFAYDRPNDAIIVFDHVRATRAQFAKRWLLHTINRPQRIPDGFSASVPPAKGPGRAGGTLRAHVLLPKHADINIIGGRGFEFFVDGKNYDENGKVFEVLKKRLAGRYHPEPGAWRVEVSPPRDQRSDNFLVVMLPTLGSEHPDVTVRYETQNNRPGCMVIGVNRTVRWIFDTDHMRVHVEVTEHGQEHVYDIAPKKTSAR